MDKAFTFTSPALQVGCFGPDNTRCRTNARWLCANKERNHMGRNNSNRSGGKSGRGGGGKGKAMKYEIRADIKVNGTVQRKDIIGAIMGQTEGLLGDDLELRQLQRTARVGHVDVEMETKNGKVHGTIVIPSSMDNVERQPSLQVRLRPLTALVHATRSSRSCKSATSEPPSERPWLTEPRNSCSPWSTPVKLHQRPSSRKFVPC